MSRTYDQIDFPCAPDWVARYADRGLTPDYPASFWTPGAAPREAPVGRFYECLCGVDVYADGRGAVVNTSTGELHAHAKPKPAKPIIWKPAPPKEEPRGLRGIDE